MTDPKDVDEYCVRVIAVLHRAKERGDLTEDQFAEALRDLAKWAVAKYAKMPGVTAVDHIMGVLLGASGAKPPLN